MSTDPNLDQLMKDVLESAKDIRPSDAVKERVLGELLESPAPPAPPPSSGAGAWATSKLMRWVGGGALLSLLLGGLYFASVQDAPSEPVAQVQPPLAPPEPTPLVDEPRAEPPPPAPPPPVDAPSVDAPPPEPVAEVKPSRPPPPKPRPAPVPTPAAEEEDLLALEVSLLDQARTQLPASPANALAALDRHSKQFPKGSLKLEASLLRVEALVKAGRRAEAERLGAKLAAQDPDGPLGLRVKRLLAPER